MDIQFLDRPEGRLSYTVEGSGPLVVAVPGMGDLRSTWRELAAPVVAAGYRLAVMDLRGHGDADTTFSTHGDIATAGDIVALIDHLGGPAVVVGNSMSASAAVWAATEKPDAVVGMVLSSPLLRNPGSATAQRFLRVVYRVLFARPWGAFAWSSYYSSVINKGTKAPWLPGHVADIRSSLRQPGRLRSFRELALQLDHSVIEPRVHHVTTPSFVAIGALDPDFSDPAAEVAWIAENLPLTETLLIDDVAHYPHTQRPDLFVPRALEFLDRIRTSSAWTANA